MQLKMQIIKNYLKICAFVFASIAITNFLTRRKNNDYLYPIKKAFIFSNLFPLLPYNLCIKKNLISEIFLAQSPMNYYLFIYRSTYLTFKF